MTSIVFNENEYGKRLRHDINMGQLDIISGQTDNNAGLTVIIKNAPELLINCQNYPVSRFCRHKNKIASFMVSCIRNNRQSKRSLPVNDKTLS